MSSAKRFERKVGQRIRSWDLGFLRITESLLAWGYPPQIQMPLLAVCGPPRTGHTLTYQCITQGLKVFVVDNLQYVFYRTPLVGYLLAKIFCRPYISDFKSEGGYIPGLNGPQQAYFVWKHWCDMDNTERRPQSDPTRLRRFGRLLNKLYQLDGRPYCSSWLGHAFYFEQLQAIFTRNIIIRTRRDLISTAMSILELTKNQNGEHSGQWVSLRPREIQSPSRLSPQEKVAWQVYFINRRIDDQVATGRYAVLDSDYVDLCENPRDFLSRLTALAKTRGILLESRTGGELPTKFTATKWYCDQNEHTTKIAKALSDLQDQYGPISVPLEPA